VPNNGGCGGFGNSELYLAPPWQIPLLTPTPPTSPVLMRQVPDVVAYAFPGIYLFQACEGGDPGPPQACSEWGTSLATPVWAAGVALINQAQGAPSGALLPALYALKSTSAFHPPSTMMPLSSVPGGGNTFQQVGLGSPNFGALAALLNGTPVPTPTPQLGPLQPGDILVADPNAASGAGALVRVNPITGAQSVVTSGGSFGEP